MTSVAIPLKQGLIFNKPSKPSAVTRRSRNPFEAGTNFQYVWIPYRCRLGGVAIPLKQGLIFNTSVRRHLMEMNGRNPFEAGTNFQ